MAKVLYRRTSCTDCEYVQGVKNRNENISHSLYDKCRQAFDRSCSMNPLIDEEEHKDLFQDSFMILWENIEGGIIYTSLDEVYVKNPKGTEASVGKINDLTNYFLGIVRNKERELLKTKKKLYDNQEAIEYEYILNCVHRSDDQAVMRDRIVNECVRNLPKRCKEILTMYYYEDKSLQEILEIRQENQSYDGLKSAKSKCIRTLKNKIVDLFDKFNI